MTTEPLTTSSAPKLHSTAGLSAQKKAVKAGLKRELVLNQVWAPVAFGWFNQWKKYADFDDECGDEQRPGNL